MKKASRAPLLLSASNLTPVKFEMREGGSDFSDAPSLRNVLVARQNFFRLFSYQIPLSRYHFVSVLYPVSEIFLPLLPP
jgi:hypothetical protein